MKKRTFDPTGWLFCRQLYSIYDDQQKVQDDIFILRWRLEPKDEDIEKWKQRRIG